VNLLGRQTANKTDNEGVFCSLGRGICFQGGRHIAGAQVA